MTLGRVRMSALMSTGLALLLCAGCTTVSADSPDPRKCSRYVNPFLEETAHAAAPANEESREWVGFAVSEAGQLEVSNRDKRLAKGVLDTCEQETQEAADRAARKAKPWYKRIF